MKITPSPMMRTLPRDPVFWIVFLGLTVYGSLFIFSSSFVVNGLRYFVLQDDSMISMRYARNLASGNGLVWNPGGPRVEGYSNFLWVVMMALIHLPHFPISKICLAVQIVALVLLLGNLSIVRAIADLLKLQSWVARLACLAFSAFYFPIVNWSLQGSEVCAMIVVVTSCIFLSLKGLRSRREMVAFYTLLGLGSLLRIDGFVVFVAFFVFHVLTDRTAQREHMIVGGAILALFLGSQTLFRVWYFGDALPNTYYLKMTGYPVAARVTTGAYRMWQFLLGCKFAIPTTIGLALWLKRDRATALLATVTLTQIVYSVWVGGDAWERWGGSNRYVVIVMPLVFLMLGIAVDRWICGRGDAASGAGRLPFAVAAVGVVFLLFEWPCGGMDALLLKIPPPDVIRPDDGGNMCNVEAAILIDKVAKPGCKVAVVWAGTIPYFTNTVDIDLLGKCDPVVGHSPMHVPPGVEVWTRFFPGHQKWDYDYSIGSLKPDVLTNLPALHRDVLPYRSQYATLRYQDAEVALRIGSPAIKWQLLGPPPQP